MIIVRTVMQAQFGKAGQLAAEFSRSSPEMASEVGLPNRRWRVLTDLSGQFDRLAREYEVESLTEWEQSRAKMFQQPSFRKSFERVQSLVVSGSTEFWTLEAEG